MSPRFDAMTAAPKTLKAMNGFEMALRDCGLEHSLVELVKMRASQINGCAFCLHMHATDARKAGESEMRLYLLNAWRESTAYSDRERAALAWTEALTHLSDHHEIEEAYGLVEAQFSEAEQANLTLLVGAINVWNRLQVGANGTHPDL